MCVHVYADVRSRVHTSVFQLDTCLCSSRTRPCYQMNSRVSLCFCVRINVCVHVCSTHVCVPLSTCVCSRVRMCVSHVYTYMCVHVYTHVCSYQARVCVPCEHSCVYSTRTNMCVHVCTHVCSNCTRLFFHVCTYVCSRVHICVLHVYAHVCSTWTGVCVPGGQMCVPPEHITMC